jgi:hypothetical protein
MSMRGTGSKRAIPTPESIPPKTARPLRSAQIPNAIPLNAGAASFVDVGGREVDHTVKVSVTRLDDFIAENRVSRVDFVKIDVEGFEAEVLKGGSVLLSQLKPRVILLEENGRIDRAELPEALRILLAHGYAIFGLPKRLLSVEMVPLDRVRIIGAHDFVAIRK